MTIEEMKIQKRAMEDAIRFALVTFSQNTGLLVTALNADYSTIKDGYGEVVSMEYYRVETRVEL